MLKKVCCLIALILLFQPSVFAQGYPSQTSSYSPDVNITNHASQLQYVNPPLAAYNGKNNEFLTVWSGNYEGQGDYKTTLIFAQRMAADGSLQGPKIQVSENSGTDGVTKATDPVVHYNYKTNHYLIIWLASYEVQNSGLPRNIIRGRYLDAATGEKIGLASFPIGGEDTAGKFAANQFISAGYVGAPALAFNDSASEYLIAWTGNANFKNSLGKYYQETEVFGQRLSGSAQVGIDDFRITYFDPEERRSSSTGLPAIDYNGINNEYMLVFEGHTIYDAPNAKGEPHGSYIFSQRIDAKGVSLSTHTIISPQVMFMDGPAIAFNSSKNEYMVVWKVGRASAGRSILGQRISATGAMVGALNTSLTDEANSSFSYPAISYRANRGQYVLIWHGKETHKDVYLYGQLLNGETGLRVGVESFRISQRKTGTIGFSYFPAAERPAIAINSTPNSFQIFTAWPEYRFVHEATGNNIFAKIFVPYEENVQLPEIDLDAPAAATPTPGPSAPAVDLQAKIEKVKSGAKDNTYKFTCLNLAGSPPAGLAINIFQSKNKKLEKGIDATYKQKVFKGKKSAFNMKISKGAKLQPFIIIECSSASGASDKNAKNNVASMKL